MFTCGFSRIYSDYLALILIILSFVFVHYVHLVDRSLSLRYCNVRVKAQLRYRYEKFNRFRQITSINVD